MGDESMPVRRKLSVFTLSWRSDRSAKTNEGDTRTAAEAALEKKLRLDLGVFENVIADAPVRRKIRRDFMGVPKVVLCLTDDA